MRIDHQIEQLLVGEASDETALAGLLGELRSLAVERVPESIARRHVSAAAAAVAAVVEPSDRRAVLPLPLRFDPANRVHRRLLGARAAISAVACFALMISLASAGILPPPVQAAVASIAERVGLHLPTPDNTGVDPDRDRRSPDPVPTTGPSTGQDRPPEAPPAGRPPGTPTGPLPSVPAGPPPGTPTGPPSETPTGPPPGTPSGPPEGTHGGESPEETPSEPSVGAPGARASGPGLPTSGPPGPGGAHTGRGVSQRL